MVLAAVGMQACSSTSPTIVLSTFATIGPDQWTTSAGYSTRGCGSGGLGLVEGIPSHGWDSAGDTLQVAAGYADENTAGGCHNTQVFRGAVHFDLSSVGSTHVAQAFLHFTRRSSAAGASVTSFTSNAISCAGSIQVVTDSWLSTPDTPTRYDYGGPPSSALLPAAAYLTMPADDVSGQYDDLTKPDAKPNDVAVNHDATTQVTSFTADVTSQVKEWLSSGSANDGFTLVSVRENLAAGDNDTCISLYDSFTLELFVAGTQRA
jgi:hypothetical protein